MLMTMSMEGLFTPPPPAETLHERLAGFIAFALHKRAELVVANDSMLDIFTEHGLSNAEQYVIRSASSGAVPEVHDVIKLAPDIGGSRVKNIFNVRYRFPVVEYFDADEDPDELQELTVNDIFAEVNVFNGPRTRYLINTKGIWRYETADEIVQDPRSSTHDYFVATSPGAELSVDEVFELLDTLEQINGAYEPKRQHNPSTGMA